MIQRYKRKIWEKEKPNDKLKLLIALFHEIYFILKEINQRGHLLEVKKYLYIYCKISIYVYIFI